MVFVTKGLTSSYCRIVGAGATDWTAGSWSKCRLAVWSGVASSLEDIVGRWLDGGIC